MFKSLVFFVCFMSATAALLTMPRSNRYGIITSYDSPKDESDFVIETKRYDRNCFFSPVQCMLTFNEDNRLPLVVTRKGKRATRQPLSFDYSVYLQ